MADNPSFFVDSKQPWVTANYSAVTPTTTFKTIWPNGSSNPTILPSNYWTVGKKMRITAFASLTTGTAGNSQWGLGYGSADNPTAIVTTAARAKVASVGPFGVMLIGYATCRTIGTAGTLSMFGMVVPDLGVALSTTDNWVFPSNGTTVVSTIDTTAATNGLIFQYLTSAGTDSIVTTDITLEAMN